MSKRERVKHIIHRGEKKIKDKITKLPTLSDVVTYFNKLKEEIPRMPITVFYSYLWRHDKTLLLKSLAVNYILPLLLEILPFVFILFENMSKKKIKYQFFSVHS